MSIFLNSADAADYPASTHPKINSCLSDLAGLRAAINTYMAADATVAMMDEIKQFIQI